MDFTHNFQTLQKKIKAHTASIGIIGLGYVGLPLAIQIAYKQFQVIGFDKDLTKIHAIQNEVCYVKDVNLQQFYASIQNGYFTVTTDFQQLAKTDIIIICVPTPTDSMGNPDLTAILETTCTIAKYAKKDSMIILESTTYPGTTQEVLQPILEKAHFQFGSSSFLVFSPERIDPGNQQFHITNIPKVVGGVSKNCTALAKLFYEEFIECDVLPVSSPMIAEMEKLLENTFRNVNIALANEMAKLCHQLNIDVWEVIEAAATKPYGFMPFYPGPGVGGHCIPIDPKFLNWRAQQASIDTSLIREAIEINEQMPQYIVERLLQYIKKDREDGPLTITVIGIAYKKNVDDYRESPTLSILEIFNHLNIKWQVVDPCLPTFQLANQIIDTVPLSVDLITNSDGVLIVTNHDEIQYSIIDSYAKCIFDTRNTNYPFQNKHYFRL